MIKETTAKAATVDEAIEIAVNEIGVAREKCEIEIIEAPKKSLFGKIKGSAVVRVRADIEEKVEIPADFSTSNKKLEVGITYLRQILDSMGLIDVKMDVKEKEDGAVVTFDGEGMAILIGHHGETLDSLQYLVALTCNRIDGDYYRITLDCGNYREKREATLKSLAERIAQKVKKTGRSQLLEPMNPYERRIIHAVVTEISGVSSKSKGEEPNRRVVIMSDTPSRGGNPHGGNRRNSGDFQRKPYVHKKERTMEEILKNDFKDKEASAELYSKIEF